MTQKKWGKTHKQKKNNFFLVTTKKKNLINKIKGKNTKHKGKTHKIWEKHIKKHNNRRKY